MTKDKTDSKNIIDDWLKTNQEFKELHSELREGGFYVHAIAKQPDSWAGLTPKEKEERSWYLPICSVDEIERIFSPKNVSDILLHYRAESIIDNMRILRSFEKKACNVPESKWTLTSQFSNVFFNNFLNNISPEVREKVKDVAFGTLYSDDPNACCIPTQFGPLIVLSEALNKFFYYMNLSLYPYWSNFDGEIQIETQNASLLLAFRTMLMTEAFDFEIDPRGMPPIDIHNRLEEIVEAEMAFVIAHEYSHYLLGHLNENSLSKKHYSKSLSDSEKKRTISTYTKSQKEEFKADELAIELLTNSDPNGKGDCVLFAITTMLYFNLFSQVYDKIYKTEPSKTHPSDLDRVKKLYYIGRKVWSSEEMSTYRNLKKIFSRLKKNLFHLYKKDPSILMKYGSIYLGQWKEKCGIDRFDY